MLKKYGINPDLIKPTGQNSRILKEDVVGFLNRLSEHKKEQPKEIRKETKEPTKKETPEVKSTPQKPFVEDLSNDKVVKISGFQKAMTKTMTQAADIPSFLFTDEYNVDKLVKLRKEINSLNKDFKITYMPFLIKAASLALEKYPIMNSTVDSRKDSEGLIQEFTIKKDHNISVAIDGPEGLVVPHIKRVQDKSIVEIQKELNILREKAENRKLTLDELKGGTFTISNIGNIGGKVLSPVILPPQTCIIGVSKFFDSITVLPKSSEVSESQAYHLVENKDLLVVFHKTVNICVSADHRILDGATVARFSSLFQSYIENPLKIWLTK
jgi:2-oxoisovalerate dehydrogenase E2 component (dihydrolipoyl transacylase)